MLLLFLIGGGLLLFFLVRMRRMGTPTLGGMQFPGPEFDLGFPEDLGPLFGPGF